MSTLGNRLKRARKEAGYDSASEAADALGWNGNTYRSVENGTRKSGINNAVDYADAFDVRLDWLLTGRGPMKRGTTQLVPIFHLSDITGRTNRSRGTLVIKADARGYVAVPDEQAVSRQTKAFLAVDSSMVDPAGSAQSIYPGDLVGIELGAEPYPGCVALVEYPEKTFIFRKLQIRKTTESGKPAQVALMPLNPDYATELVPASAIVGVKIWLQRHDRRP